MSQFYDQASLVMVPSGYKNGKVYSQKPLSADGELTFSRASNATRVNSSGLVEKVRTNVALYSEDQSNAVYVAIYNAIASRTAVANPLTGSNNAYKVLSDGNNDPYFGQSVTGLSNGPNVFSCWLWTDSGQSTEAAIFLYNSNGSEVFVESVTLTTTPTRYSVAANFTNVGAFATIRVDLCQTCGVTYLYTYGWQAETGDIATDYIATTSTAVSVGPVSGLPRLDYSGGATCPSLLLEGQRTNQILQSEAFGSASWSVFNASISSNVSATLDPQGYYGADKLVEDSSSAFHDVDQVQTYTSAPHTISVFAKSAGRDHIFLQHFDGVTFFTSGTFNLANGTVSGSGSIEAYSNGWYRCSFTATTVSGTGKSYINLSNGTSGNYAGNGTDGVYLWGAMLEQGSYSSSYLNTLSTAVTRVADAASKTGIGSLFGGSYTLFGEYVNQAINGTRLLTVKIPSAGYYDNFITIFQSGTGLTATGNDASSAAQFSIASGSYSVGQTLKFALRCQANNVAFYINGVQIGTDNNATIPAVTALWVGNYVDVIERSLINQVLCFPNALSNADLATLTTL